MPGERLAPDEGATAEGETTEVDGRGEAAELEVLRERNARLREADDGARRSTYRRTAGGFVLVGAVATLGGAVLPGLRTVLFALGGTGAFAGLLTHLVTPEQIVPGTVSEAVYRRHAATFADVTDALDLGTEGVYVPRTVEGRPRLFVPESDGYRLPGDDALASPFVVTGDARERGLSVRPTGSELVRELERASPGPLPDRPAPLVERLREGVVEQFELAEAVALDLDEGAGRLTVRATDPVHGGLAAFDHPVVSLFGCGLARGLDGPVSVESASGENEDVVAFRFETGGHRRGGLTTGEE